MGHTVTVALDVTPEAAERLKDDDRRRQAAAVLSLLVTKDEPLDPLILALRRLQAAAAGAGLTEAEIDAALDAYRGEHRH